MDKENLVQEWTKVFKANVTNKYRQSFTFFSNKVQNIITTTALNNNNMYDYILNLHYLHLFGTVLKSKEYVIIGTLARLLTLFILVLL